MEQNISKQNVAKERQFSIWWRQMRPHTLTASFIPVTLGTALGLSIAPFHFWLFISMLVASMLIQSATNLFNEYFDYKRGLDHQHSVGIGGGIVRDGIRAETIKRLAFIFMGIAMLIGVYICYNTSWWIALVGLICMAVGYFYTGGPYPIAYTPFGELVSGFFMGMVIVLISFFIQTQTITTQSVLLSIPIMILVGGILMSNNIRDLEGDKKAGRHTLAILLGRNGAIAFLAGMFIVSYLWVLALILFGHESYWLLLVFLSIAKPIQATKIFKEKTASIHMMPAMKATAETNTFFGLLMAIGLVIQYIVK